MRVAEGGTSTFTTMGSEGTPTVKVNELVSKEITPSRKLLGQTTLSRKYVQYLWKLRELRGTEARRS